MIDQPVDDEQDPVHQQRALELFRVVRDLDVAVQMLELDVLDYHGPADPPPDLHSELDAAIRALTEHLIDNRDRLAHIPYWNDEYLLIDEKSRPAQEFTSPAPSPWGDTPTPAAATQPQLTGKSFGRNPYVDQQHRAIRATHH